MIADRSYSAPLRWDAIDAPAFDGLLLPGGHRARGMREYLESKALQTSGLHRDTMEDARPAFVVRDRHYISARWPGDAHTFAESFASLWK